MCEGCHDRTHHRQRSGRQRVDADRQRAEGWHLRAVRGQWSKRQCLFLERQGLGRWRFFLERNLADPLATPSQAPGAIHMKTRIEDAISYDPETGEFRWKASPSRNVKAGSVAGWTDKDGYIRIEFAGKRHSAGRVAWRLMTGAWPTFQVDHRNLIRADNRWDNLREATQSQNAANKSSWGNLPKGVTLHRKSGRYQAQIGQHGKNHYLGLFDSPAAAHKAYYREAIRRFGEFARAS